MDLVKIQSLQQKGIDKMTVKDYIEAKAKILSHFEVATKPKAKAYLERETANVTSEKSKIFKIDRLCHDLIMEITKI